MMRNIYRTIAPYQMAILQSQAERSLREFREQLLRNYNLRSPDWFVLGYVASDDKPADVKVGDIASMLGVHSTYVTAVLRRLETHGLVGTRTDRYDRRARIVTVTKKGGEVAQAIDQAFAEQSAKLFGNSTDKDLEGFVAVLKQLAASGPSSEAML